MCPWAGEQCDDVRVPDWPGLGSCDLGFLDAFLDAAVVVDREGLLVSCNSAAEQLLGVSSDLIHGRAVRGVLFDESSQDAFREVAERVVAGQAWRGELEVVDRDGSTVPVEVGCAPVRNGEQVIALILVLRELEGVRSRCTLLDG